MENGRDPVRKIFASSAAIAGLSTGSISGSWMARSNSERGGTTVRLRPRVAISSSRPMSDRFTAFARVGKAVVTFSRRLVAAVDVLHVGERNTGAFLPRVIEIEGVARQEDEVTVEILGDRRTVGGDEAIEGFLVFRRDPARELEFGRVPVHLEPVFVGEPHP